MSQALSDAASTTGTLSATYSPCMVLTSMPFIFGTMNYIPLTGRDSKRPSKPGKEGAELIHMLLPKSARARDYGTSSLSLMVESLIPRSGFATPSSPTTSSKKPYVTLLVAAAGAESNSTCQSPAPSPETAKTKSLSSNPQNLSKQLPNSPRKTSKSFKLLIPSTWRISKPHTIKLKAL